MAGGLTGPQLTFFAILIAAFALLPTERLRNDVVAVLIVLALAATGLLTPAEALAERLQGAVGATPMASGAA